MGLGPEMGGGKSGKNPEIPVFGVFSRPPGGPPGPLAHMGDSKNTGKGCRKRRIDSFSCSPRLLRSLPARWGPNAAIDRGVCREVRPLRR